MRIAAISDIHGNLPALEAVLDDVARRGADVVVALGDLLAGPLWPRETAERLIALGCPAIRGNHERQTWQCAERRGEASDQFTFESLTTAQLAWTRQLPATLRLADDVYCCHGTPTSDLIYLLEDPSTGRAALRATADIRADCGEVRDGLLLCGHSHIPRLVALPDGPTIVNPGAVGVPAFCARHPWPHVHELGSPHARYALVERSRHGWQAQFIAVTYDWRSAARRALDNGRPDFARWLSGWGRPETSPGSP
jgi:predicted phosphodiesterase